MLSEKFRAFRRAKLDAARKAHGHIKGADDIDCLCLHISNICQMNSERIEVMNLNAKQAQIISRLEREKSELLARLEGAGFDKRYID